MNKKTATALGITLMFLGMTTMATAYHVPNDNSTVANTWTEAIAGVLIVCESTGPDSIINDQPVGHSGFGGLCYASSQSFATCTPVPPLGVEVSCPYDEEAAMDKKPANDVISSIKPTCTFQVSSAACGPANKAAGDSDWDIEIGDGSRSCSGVWGQTFYYKEVVAYWAGFITDANGVSGHVSFFVEPQNATATVLDPRVGGYEGTKTTATTIDAAGADVTSGGKTETDCNGNGVDWGIGS